MWGYIRYKKHNIQQQWVYVQTVYLNTICILCSNCFTHGSGGKSASCASRKCYVPRTYINLGVAIHACPSSWHGRRHSQELVTHAQWDEFKNDRAGHLLFSGLWKYLYSCGPMYTNNHTYRKHVPGSVLKGFPDILLFR